MGIVSSKSLDTKYWLGGEGDKGILGHYLGSSPGYKLILILIMLQIIKHRMRVKVKGKVILVTGCDTGLGQESACRLASLGFTVIAACLTTGGSEAVKKICPEADTILLDVTDDRSISNCVSYVQNKYPNGIDGLMNNAGLAITFLIEMCPLSVFQKNMDVNYFGTIRMCKAFAPQLRRNQGRILNVASFFGRGLSGFSMSAYTSTKWAVEAFSDALRQELAVFGVHVAIMEPGTMKTPMLRKATDAMNQFWDEASEDVKADYGIDFLKCVPRSKVVGDLVARPAHSLMGSVEHAFCARYPQNRYLDGVDAWVMGGLFPLLPSPLLDIIMNLILRPPVPAMLKNKQMKQSLSLNSAE